ncbi:glycosyl hydrolase family 28-related protein [Cohnella sp. GCM10027633]|uniref:glycosyl hydrolase family 28-related protein n=1 Tax=unclassified Cohnella TaxID=2636738 RepID=UPI003625BE11
MISDKGVFNVSQYGAKGDGATDDTDAIQKAIDAAYQIGGGIVFFPAGTYVVGKVKGKAEIPAHDDGTVTAGYGKQMSPEPVYSLPYSIQMRANVILKGCGESSTILKGKYKYGAADLNQTIMLAVLGTDASFYHGLSDLNIQDAFIGYAGLDTTFALCRFINVSFNGTGICIYAQSLERCHFEELFAHGCGTLVLVGGQWTQRDDNYAEGGGWADKNYFNKITFIYQRVFGQAEQAIDKFFDTYFFKTVNNTTRLSAPLQPSSVATIIPYRGICAIAVSFLSRYYRPNNNNQLFSFFVSYNPRYAFYGGNVQNTLFDSFNFESCGYQDNVNRVGKIGIDYTDVYLGKGVKLPGMIVGIGSNSSIAQNVQLYDCVSQAGISGDMDIIHLSTGASADVSTKLPNTRMDDLTLTDATIVSPIIAGGSLSNDVAAGYHFVGDEVPFSWKTTSNGTATLTLKLPSSGIYIVNAMASGNGSYDHTISRAALVTFLKGSTYAATGAFALGNAVKAGGSLTPRDIAISGPSSTGDVVATVTGTTTASVAIRFSVTKLSKS